MFTCSLKRLSVKYVKCEFCTTAVRRVKKFEDIPGPVSLPVIGTLHNYLPLIGSYKFNRLHRNGLKKFQRYGPVVREQIVPGINLLWLFKPEDIEKMYRFEGKYPQRRSHLAVEKYRLDRPSLYNTGGLLPTNGPEWFKLRTVFQRGLSSPNCVQQFLPQLNEIIDEWWERVDALNKKKKVDYLPEISRLFLELTCFLIFEWRLYSFSPSQLSYFSQSSKLMRAAFDANSCILKTDNGLGLWKKFQTPLYRKFRKSHEYMESVAAELIINKLNSYYDYTGREKSILENYLCAPEVDLKDVLGMSCDLLLAGIDTTTYTTSFLLYHLARNPKVQNKLFEECSRLLVKPNSLVDKDVLRNASYTKAVLKETFRLNPVSVGIGRVLNEDVEFSGYHVPKETVVVTQNQVSCRLEEYFKNAEEFIPERWIKGNELFQQTHPYLLLPFGHGPRACIARRLAEQNMQTLLLKIVRNYKIRWNGGELDSKSLLINKPDGPVRLIFEKRH